MANNYSDYDPLDGIVSSGGDLPGRVLATHVVANGSYQIKRVTGSGGDNEIHGGTVVDGGAGSIRFDDPRQSGNVPHCHLSESGIGWAANDNQWKAAA